MIKLIALDLDGTLLGPDLRVSEAARAAIDQAHRAGLVVTFATGRSYRSAARIAPEAGLRSVPLIAFNGAMIRHYPDGEIRHHHPVPAPAALAVAEYATARGLALQTYLDDEIYFSAYDERTREYERISGLPARVVGPMDAFLRADGRAGRSSKLLIFESADRMPAVKADVQRLIDGEARAMTSYPFFLEVVAREVSKGVALERLAAMLGIAISEVMAIGDSENDLEMVEAAGVGAAVANAADEVKARAQLVAQAPYGDGVAELIGAALAGSGRGAHRSGLEQGGRQGCHQHTERQ